LPPVVCKIVAPKRYPTLPEFKPNVTSPGHPSVTNLNRQFPIAAIYLFLVKFTATYGLNRTMIKHICSHGINSAFCLNVGL
jgi:hypothetical protein